MAINTTAAGDSRFALTGKDGAFYDADGELLATVETFTANVAVTNAKYNVLGDAQEHETFSSYAVTLTMSQVVIEDDKYIQQFVDGLTSGQMPVWNFQGAFEGRDGSEERMIYRSCIPSGEVTLQNAVVGEPIKRNWSFFVNEPPEFENMLTVARQN